MEQQDLTPQQLYRALASRDARFDGRFFVGVTSTGIYCRPICRVRLPKQENCRFFASAVQAEAASFRPCLRCRPEQAPGWSMADAGDMLAHQAARMIDLGRVDSPAMLSQRLGISDRHLRRLFHRQFGVTPTQYFRTRRLLIAKGLLTDTQLPVWQVAEVAGFGSASRFHHHFQAHYRLSPARFRRSAGQADGALRFRLAYRPPFDWDGLLRYLSGRCIDGIDRVAEGRYRRTVALRDDKGALHEGWLLVSRARSADALELTLAASLAAVIPECMARVRAMFDLDADPERINRVLGELSADRPGQRVPGTWDGFELAARAVLGQLVSVRAATTLAGRIAALAAYPVATPWPELRHRFPLAEEFLTLEAEALGEQGINRRSIAALREVAAALVDGRLDLAYGADPVKARETLTSIRGIGDWTFNYIAMRALGWPDAFPAGDLGIRKALGGAAPRAAEAEAERWRPWRAYAVLHLWRTLP